MSAAGQAGTMSVSPRHHAGSAPPPHARLRGVHREAAAEFLGTLVMIAFGVGVVAQTVLSQTPAAGGSCSFETSSAGSYLSINLGRCVVYIRGG